MFNKGVLHSWWPLLQGAVVLASLFAPCFFQERTQLAVDQIGLWTPVLNDTAALSENGRDAIGRGLATKKKKGHLGRLSKLSGCDLFEAEKAKHERALCVQLEFEKGKGIKNDDMKVACRAWLRDETEDEMNFDESLMKGGKTNVCQKSAEHCTVFIGGVMESENYKVFCMDLGPDSSGESDSEYKNVVLPDCRVSEAKCGLLMSLEESGEFGIVNLLTLITIIAYVSFSFISKKIRILHESGFAVLFGILMGQLMYHAFDILPSEFNHEVFEYFLLPMVIFSAGFTLEREKFFKHIGYCAGLGLTGTVLVYILLFFTTSKESTGFDGSARMKMAAALSAQDTVAAVAFITPEMFPNLYAVIFGEGVLNEMVAFLLSSSAARTTSPEINAEELRRLLWDITRSCVMSMTAGISFGLIVSLVFKFGKQCHDGVVKPIVILVGWNYACYMLTEVGHSAPVFALFLCAIISNHYASYSMGPEARHFSKELAHLMEYVSEAIMYSYFGITAVRYVVSGGLPWMTILYYNSRIVLARAIAVTLFATLGRMMKCGRSLSLNWRELALVAFSGCLRGTIAFSLILRSVPEISHRNGQDNRMLRLVHGIILVKCVAFGALVPTVMKILGIKGQPITSPLPHGVHFPYSSQEFTKDVDLLEDDDEFRTFIDQGAPRSFTEPVPQARSDVSESTGPRRGNMWQKFDSRFFKPLFRTKPVEVGRPEIMQLAEIK